MFTADGRPSDDPREDNARRVDAPAAPHAVSEVIAQAWRAWHAEVDFATRFVADAPDLDVIGDDRTPDSSASRPNHDLPQHLPPTSSP
jgi:hypothetical protein